MSERWLLQKSRRERYAVRDDVSCVDEKDTSRDGAPHGGAARLRRTSVLPQAKPWRRRNSLPPSISSTGG